MSSRFERAYRVDGRTVLNAAFWNRIMRDLDTRIVGIEEKKADFEEAEKTLLDLGLRRINETLLPAAERIFRVAELGFLVASSDEEATLVQGQQASLTIREGDQRDLFTPSPFIALTRRSTTDDYAIARTIAYDRESGILLFDVETLVGNGGPHDDWDVAAMAGAVQAMVSSLDETQSLRQQVADDKAAVEQLKADTVQEKEAAQAAKLGADEAKSGAEDAKTAAEAALNSFLTVYRGAHSSPPENGEQGHFYFDTTLQQARVYTAAGWAPLFSVALGGIRQDTIEAEEAQTVFTVDGGGFTFINVFKNGVLLVPGVDYTTASPDFTLTEGAKEGDLISYTAYFATDQTDFYTKEAADERFVRFDSDQGLDPAEQSQARANIGAEVLAGFRNKVINGDFDIWQRGATITSGVYCADRWRYTTGTPSGFSVSRQSFSVGATEVPGNPRYYARMQLTQAATGGRPGFFQRIEGVRTLAGKKATLTAYVRLSVSANVSAYLNQNFGTGGSPAEQTPENNTYVEANSFQKVQHVIDVPPIIGKTIGENNDDFLEVVFRVPEGFTGNFDLAHVSLVEGDATMEDDPFSPRHIEQEWQLCYRYYERAEDGVAGYLFNIPPSRLSGSIIHRTHYPFKAKKRVAPSQTYTISSGSLPTDVATVDYGRLGANGVGSENTVQVLSAAWDAEL